MPTLPKSNYDEVFDCPVFSGCSALQSSLSLALLFAVLSNWLSMPNSDALSQQRTWFTDIMLRVCDSPAECGAAELNELSASECSNQPQLCRFAHSVTAHQAALGAMQPGRHKSALCQRA